MNTNIKKTLLVMGNQILPAEMELLSRNFEILKLWEAPDPDALIQSCKDEIVAIASFYFVPLGRDIIEKLPNLKIIAQFAVGTDNIDLAAAKERGIIVTNTPDVLTDDTADTAFALLIALSRRICESDRLVRAGQWQIGQAPVGRTLSGKVCGIVGMGRIGQAIASRCEAFGMTVLYHGPRKKEDVSYAYEADLIKIADASDYLVLACPGGASTRHLVHEPVLNALGPNSYLINVSRGSVVKEEDLVKALQNNKIAGAGLDVFAKEPAVPPELLTMENVVLLPHIGSSTQETRSIMGMLVVKNLLAYFGGDPVLTPVF